MNLQGVGVRKVSENILKDNRSVIFTEEDASKLTWSDIPDGALKINPKTGIMSVKIEGETDWVPAGIKNDGTLSIAKDSMIINEIFTIQTVPDFSDGKYASKEFTYYNTEGDIRHMPITDDNELVFEVEKGSFMKWRNHLEVIIDDFLVRSPSTGGVREINETRFAMSEQLQVGQELTVKYIRIFRIGNPYPRVFMCDEIPEASEIGDLWIDRDGTFEENDLLGENNEVNTTISWDRITGTPTTLKGYNIIDNVSYVGHIHTMADISDMPSTFGGGNADMVDGCHAGITSGTVLIIQSDGKIPTSTLCPHTHNINDIVGKPVETGGKLEKGMIIDYYGDASSIPEGWAICDGTNGTPDLRNRFVIGAGGAYSMGVTGGEAQHILSVAELPSHNHIDPYAEHDIPAPFGIADYNRNHVGSNSTDYDNQLLFTSSTGSNQPHNNIPPYCALYKIMKIQ